MIYVLFQCTITVAVLSQYDTVMFTHSINIFTKISSVPVLTSINGDMSSLKSLKFSTVYTPMIDESQLWDECI